MICLRHPQYEDFTFMNDSYEWLFMKRLVYE